MWLVCLGGMTAKAVGVDAPYTYVAMIGFPYGAASHIETRFKVTLTGIVWRG